MRIIRTVAAMQRQARQWRRGGARVGLVPTMGYLHEGHLSLVREARRRVGRAGQVVVSIYVNPTQFAPTEDLSRYPRDFRQDCRLLRAEDVDVVFAPSDTEIYPKAGSSRCDDRTAQRAVPTPFSTYVVEENMSRGMEGTSRPTHFRGVTTVVAKLFHLVLPDLAVFGAKDFQQAAIIKRMVKDLNFPLQIIVAPTVRELDGLAMSSRNKYLDADQRAQATILCRAIQHARSVVKRKSISSAKMKVEIEKFVATAPLARLDYVEFFDPETLQPVERVSRGTHMALAAFFDKTRLIDNGRL